ncbi:MAG: hypothetical protein KBS98_08440 [Flavobacterium sp.]|nr:hypothetical protein [Candidatus Neoflavobacterium equi]
MIYKFRVILDNEEDILRDIAISSQDSLEDLHNTIVNAFGFDGLEAASFYKCDDEWNQDEEEIPLFDTGDIPGQMKVMADYTLEDILDKENRKIIYVYDFMNMWSFLVELAAVEEAEIGATYPDVLFSHGIVPEVAGALDFSADEDDIFGDYEDDYDEEDMDLFDGDDSFEDMSYDF